MGAGERIERWLVTVVLVVAVFGTLLAPYFVQPVPTLVEPVQIDGPARLQAAIELLGAGDSVVVAFEYGPAEAGEMDAVAGPILRHMHDQGATISAVSTQPMGIAAAEALRVRVDSEGAYALSYGVDYLPGGATGIAQLLAHSDTRPAQILVLAAQPAPLRWWVEQARARYGNAAPPVVAGVSAALESAASPYLDENARQLDGAIIGLGGAAAYETLRGASGQATQRLNALAVGQVAIVALMLVGMVTHVLGGQRGRE
jgi:hypothetical protein